MSRPVSPEFAPEGNANSGYESDVSLRESASKIQTPLQPPRIPGLPNPESSFNIEQENSEIKCQKTSSIAIKVKRGIKTYGKQKVLNGLSMIVQEGTIYGLLGSSGCGKTTILSCIVGLRQLDEGKITIFGKTPGASDCGVPGRLVGYMPQEVALNEEFTMMEVCQYFGRFYGMSKHKVYERMEYLVELLDLEKCSGQLSKFSGGQKRRVSFLIALLHEPEILILDEPTVGVDPILRAKIWNHIRELTDRFGITVVITTHYIEEMRQAERVGIMRDGRLMAEASPNYLLAYHNASMLEDVVLKYCLKTSMNDQAVHDSSSRRSTITAFEPNHKRKSVQGDELIFCPHEDPVIPSPNRHQKKTTKVNIIWALTRKNVIVILRNVGFLLFLLIVPAIILSFFAIGVGKPPSDLGLGVINEETDMMDCGEMASLECRGKDLACSYVNILKSFDVFNLHNYKTVTEALKGVEDEKIWGYIHFEPNFSKNVFDRTLGRKFSNDTIHGSKIRVKLDMSNISTGNGIKKLLYDAYRIFSQTLLTACQVDISGRDLPVEFEEPIYGQHDGSFTAFVVPGILIGFLPFMSCISCAMSYIIEKKDGMLDRTKVAGVTALDIMISHGIPQFGIVVIQCMICFAMMYFFDIPFDIGSPLLAFWLVVMCAVTGMNIGFAAAEIFDEEKNAMLFAMAALMPSFLISGLMWPREGLPSAFKIASNFLPGTHPAASLRSILLRGWGLTHYGVYMGFVSQYVFIFIFMCLTFIIHKLRK